MYILSGGGEIGTVVVIVMKSLRTGAAVSGAGTQMKKMKEIIAEAEEVQVIKSLVLLQRIGFNFK